MCVIITFPFLFQIKVSHVYDREIMEGSMHHGNNTSRTMSCSNETDESDVLL
jgi:hypothetical protein